jgi:hypothetical protein
MNGHHRRGWWLLAGLVIVIGGLLLLYRILPGAGLTAAVGSSVLAVVMAHLGILAVLLAPIYALLRRRSRR